MKNLKNKKVVTNRFGKKIELRKVYEKGERFYGQVLVRNVEMTSGYRIPLKEWLQYEENHKNNNETEYKVLNTMTGTYRMVFSDDDNQFQIKKNGIVLRRFELGYSADAYTWLKNMKETDELENENAELRDEIKAKLTTGERIRQIFSTLYENGERLSKLIQQMFPLNY